MEWYIELLNEQHAAQLQKKEMFWVEEIRLAAGQPLMLRGMRREEMILPKLSPKDLDRTLQAACRQSIYAHAETLRRGFVTVEGGHRIGVCGYGVMQQGDVQSIRAVSSLVIRIARQIIGCADDLAGSVTESTLILGPPGCGKTTLLRDLVRVLSDKNKQRVALVDERGEISASLFGVPQMQIGVRTDVLINIPKSKAAMMLLRCASPQWIAVDEITSPDDIRTMEEISYCGVSLVATAHALDAEDLIMRPLYRELMSRKIFRHLVILRADKSYTLQEVSA